MHKDDDWWKLCKILSEGIKKKKTDPKKPLTKIGLKKASV